MRFTRRAEQSQGQWSHGRGSPATSAGGLSTLLCSVGKILSGNPSTTTRRAKSAKSLDLCGAAIGSGRRICRTLSWLLKPIESDGITATPAKGIPSWLKNSLQKCHTWANFSRRQSPRWWLHSTGCRPRAARKSFVCPVLANSHLAIVQASRPAHHDRH